MPTGRVPGFVSRGATLVLLTRTAPTALADNVITAGDRAAAGGLTV
jgi:hypothetical protein